MGPDADGVRALGLKKKAVRKTTMVADDVRTVVTMKKAAQKKRAFNPKKLQFETTPAPVVDEPADVFWERLQGNWQILASNCVSMGSRVTYHTAWKHWEIFCGRIKAPVSLAVVFPGWRPETSIHPYEVTMVVSYIAYLQSRISPKLKPGTVDNYVTGLRHCLTQCGVDEKVFKVQVIRQCRAALQIHISERQIHPSLFVVPRSTMPCHINSHDIQFQIFSSFDVWH